MEDNGLTFTDVLNVIFKKIWWVVGSMALGLIVVVLIMQLWYNPTVKNYSVSFEISYPDKTEFLSTEFISLSALKQIRDGEYSGENTAEFEGVNVESMFSNDDISISRDSTAQPSGVVKTVYTLTVKASYFKSGKQAASFIRKVSTYPVITENEYVASKNYRPYVNVYDGAKTYSEKIEALLSQKKYLQTEYGLLMNIDKSSEVKLAALENVFTSTQRQYLQDTISANHYVLDPETYAENAVSRKEVIRLQKENNLNIIAQLQAEREEAINKPTQGEGQNAYDTRIAEYIVKNAVLDNEAQEIEDTLDAIEKYTVAGSTDYAKKQEFDELLDGYRAQLVAATDTLKEESVRIYGENTDVIYSNNKIEKKGGMSVLASAIIGLVIGLLISSVVICIIDLPKYKRLKFGAKQSENAELPEATEEIPQAAEDKQEESGEKE